MLSLYSRGDAIAEKQVDAVRSISVRPITRRLPMPGPIAFGRGILVELEVNELGFQGGSPFLFGSVMEQFFSRYVSINSFVEVVLRGSARGEIMRWIPRCGSRSILVALLKALESEPYRFGFYRTLRDLENAYPKAPRIGTAVRPQDEMIRLAQNPTMEYAPATFLSVTPAKGPAPTRLVQQFFGMFGPNGPLPLHLTEFARERLLHHRDPSLVRFIDLLVHRPLTLFYRGWSQAQPAVSFDRPQSDRFSAYVGSLVGMGTPHLRKRDAAGDHVRLYFSGWFARQPRTSDGLRSVLEGFFPPAGAHRRIRRPLDELAAQ